MSVPIYPVPPPRCRVCNKPMPAGMTGTCIECIRVILVNSTPQPEASTDE